jgi:hypothetical protein
MFDSDALVELADRDRAGSLEKTLAAFGEFLNIHYMSLSSGDRPLMPLSEGDMNRLCLRNGAGQTTAQGGVNNAH